MTKYCFSSSNKYLDYSCHRKLNEYFNRKDIFNELEDKAKTFLQNITLNKGYSDYQKNIFNKLYHFLKGDGIFMWQDESECCKYINYWLNTEVQNILPNLYDNKSFENFQNILNFYNEDKQYNKRCISYIKYIEPYDLKKMDIIYSLYKNYKKLIEEHRNHDYAPCIILTDIYLIYKDALDLYGNNDDNMFSRLKEFKKKMDPILPQHKICPYNIQFKDPESIKKPQITESEQRRGTHDQTQITKELAPTEPESPPSKPESPPPELDSQTSPVLQDESLQLQDPQFRSTPSTSRSNELSRMALEETYSGLSQTTYNRNSEGQRLQPGSDHTRGLTYSDELGNSFIPGNVGLEKLGRPHTEDGFLDKVQGAFSSIAEHVEPAPILGVSGGMGALFLLFKYTPVGTFFRGGRGRVRRIPSGFHGQFLGAFPDIQDYYGGNIGYGPMNPLAE
ncbi:unnamed protein product [Plasmodium vivax]|uniref:(malaria parasite P. vivax) hypothetical protein n=1 Tax=Plasmodium vivax TaxID=5855 RepID=A0A8S4HHH5_PLAVI|nr:unnamed protein product [Plasmodium vivax]